MLPSGMSYRLLVLPSYNADDRPVLHVEGNYVYTESPLPKVETMTPQLLRRIKELVEDGATVLGTRPLKSPSLTGFPQCDEELTRLADELWGKNAGHEGSGERRVGKGRVIWGATPEQVLARHERARGLLVRSGDSRQAALYAPSHGRRPGTLLRRQQDRCRRAGNVRLSRGGWATGILVAADRPDPSPSPCMNRPGSVTRVPMRLEPHESVFVVFRPGQEVSDPAISVTRDGRSICPHRPLQRKSPCRKPSTAYSATRQKLAT